MTNTRTAPPLPAPARNALIAMYVGLALTIAAALIPYLASGSLSHQMHQAEDGYVKGTDTDTAVAAVQLTLAGVAGLGVICWLGMIFAVHKRQRWSRVASTVLLVIAEGIALATVFAREYGHTLVPAGIGTATLLPSLAGLVAVGFLWMWKRDRPEAS
ncbi:MAG TPA: hypothetical protein VE172_15770 [Stackebrandtia sp.]|jgi:hypothetical protein|uniref:hypothetical protein n=1 Tax=Stackebrandtia sp. TaxID=2023065 RepID=UPI002D562AE2|nr:hypothetical protein [Stackebrandtia sp.]HZE40262.1 hypothetical protein [Stackebrandtia sp.]